MLPSALFLLFLASLPFTGAAPQPGSGSIRIPLTKRAPKLIRRGNTLDHYAAAASHVRARYGYANSTTRRKRANSAGESIIDQGQDQSYLGSVNIGSPAQQFNLILDTGSADLWVAGSSCTSCSSSTPTFSSSQSSSFQSSTNSAGQQQSLTIKYGSGEVAGTLASDSVTMSGFQISEQQFVVVDQTSSGLLSGSNAGIMGLGFQAIASSGATPFWEALVNANQLSQPMMSFWLRRLIDDSQASSTSELYGGEFTLGGTNTSLYTGDVQFIDFPSGAQPSFWLLSVSGVTVQGKSVSVPTGNGALAAIDTGTTLIGGPSDAVQAVWAAVPGSQALSGEYSGFYSFPCNTNVEVSISFGGNSWPISPADMNLGAINGNTCLGGIFDLTEGADVGSGNPSWVVGDTFLKNVYTVFRANPPSVGFAQLSSAAGGSSGSSSVDVGTSALTPSPSSRISPTLSTIFPTLSTSLSPYHPTASLSFTLETITATSVTYTRVGAPASAPSSVAISVSGTGTAGIPTGTGSAGSESGSGAGSVKVGGVGAVMGLLGLVAGAMVL
ncbi:acid protease [Neolentinus lepideus HHB14362 ss-1]|uniref:Acid protease n=1 Tax=Neolentinus lepideus HHB14362 ss-1 TaxID=1314782 RepID=A0A165V3F6_9AGAM|nr:acid protease [Neolentinus lepideus HHB14362 ss-1]